MTLGVFIFLAALSVISAIGTVAQRNPVHCLLALVVTLLTIAVLFIGLDAVAVGFLQMIVYAGAIMVLFLFVIWLLNLQAEVRTAPGHLALKAFSGLLFAALVAELFVLLWHAPSAAGARVSLADGKVTVTDGPFTESKELISYALYEVRSKEEAIEWASRFIKLHRDHWAGWTGSTDILQVMGPAGP